MALNPAQFGARLIGAVDYKGNQWAIDWSEETHEVYQCPQCLSAWYTGVHRCGICGLPTTFHKTVRMPAKTIRYHECSLCHGLTKHLYHGNPPPNCSVDDFPTGVYCKDCWHGILDCSLFVTALKMEVISCNGN